MHYKILNFLIITIVISINLFVFCATASKEKDNTSIFQQQQLQQQQLLQHQQQIQQQQQQNQHQQQQQQSSFGQQQQHQYYNNQQQDYNPMGPLVKCSFVPWEFLDCKEPYDHKGNVTAKEEMNHGCLKFGGVYYEDVERTKVRCTVLPDIECHGNRVFFRDGVPCIRKTGHYFVTTLLYSILLGFLGMDRFSLGQTGTAVGKLLTLGGVGVWWIIDIILLVTNNLLPEDGSNWNSYV